MNGPEHYKEAERLLVEAQGSWTSRAEQLRIEAGVHATLALTAATALPAVKRYYGDDTDIDRAWAGIAS